MRTLAQVRDVLFMRVAIELHIKLYRKVVDYIARVIVPN